MPEGVVVRHAGRVALFDPDTVSGANIGAYLRRGEFYESGMLEYVRLLGLQGRYVDAGAAIGTHTVFFASICDAEEVYSFEPRDWVFALLAKNIAINGLGDRVRAYNIGLSGEVETVSAHLDGQRVQFETAQLDSIVTSGVALVKIDVEGMETKVIDGAGELLRTSSPIVLAEATDAAHYDELVARMRRHGYTPTGRYFNASPTFEFWPRRERRTTPTKASHAYASAPAQRRPPYGAPQEKQKTGPRYPLRVRVVKLIDRRTPWLGRALRKVRRLRSTRR